MANEKVKPENLTASARSPVIPVVKEPSALKAKDLADKAEKKAQGKAEELVKGELNTAAKTTEDDQKPAQSPDKKPKKKPKKDQPSASGSEHSETPFPASIRINDYGFINMRKGLLDSLGWHKGMELKLEKNADDSVTVRKA